MKSPIPLALYIHIPWCEKKCPYCDFNSHQQRGDVDEAAYISALLSDLDNDIAGFSQQLQDRQLSSIFIGGGTPSLFSPDSFKDLLNGVQQRIAFSSEIEITSEANPGSSEIEKFSGFREAGVNRLSIGIQSFNQQHLLALGRVHNANDALKAAGIARSAGFENFNLDLMFGLPKQSVEQAIQDLEQAIELTPSHLSCYQLTIEPNTLFHHQPPVTPGHESLWEMQAALQHRLTTAGYRQYEVSAYAQPEHRCKHNLNYWQFGDYLGIGAGAHSKITGSNYDISRRWKIKHPNSYLKSDTYVGGHETVDLEQAPFEFMLNALRLTDGFDLALFEQRTGRPISCVSEVIDKHTALELIDIDQSWFCPTERGKQLLDTMLQDYLPD